MYALKVAYDNGTMLLVQNRLDNDVILVHKSYSHPYDGAIGKARAKYQVMQRNIHFRKNAWSWGCGQQDYYADVTDMIADEAGLDNHERYAGRYS